MRTFLTALACTLLAAPLSAADLEPGHSTFGEKKYIEYIAGDLPLIISAPHGGRETPDDIPTRDQGVVQSDRNTQELARSIAAEIHARTGHHPHLVICRLHRQKLDCNREIAEAAAGDPIAEKAWAEYHAFLDQARATAIAASGNAFYIDLHGQNHADRRIELGYLHSHETLAKPEESLNDPAVARAGSLRRLAEKTTLSYVELLRGPRSLGALLEARGFPCTPSPERPVPNLPYFPGGYSVRRHVPADEPIAGVQIECNLTGLRDTEANRTRFATALVATLREYLAEHFALPLPQR